MDDYSAWRQRLVASELPQQTKVVLNAMWKINASRRGASDIPHHQEMQFLEQTTGMHSKVILKNLNIAYKKRWLSKIYAIHGMPITDIHEVELLTKEIVLPKKEIKTRAVKNAAKLQTLQDWELKNGVLRLCMIVDWVAQKKLSTSVVQALIEEFRTEMGMKGKLYADFRLAFMTYLTKGYLSKSLEQSKYAGVEQGHVRTTTRGVSI